MRTIITTVGVPKEGLYVSQVIDMLQGTVPQAAMDVLRREPLQPAWMPTTIARPGTTLDLDVKNCYGPWERSFHITAYIVERN